MDKVSIVVPVYNKESLIGKCLNSLVEQTLANIEIIVVDDGSFDSSGLICDDYTEKDFRIKVIHQKNGGIGSAYNTALKLVSGNYLLFVDSDDYIAPNMIMRLLQLLHEYDADIVQCDRYSFRNHEGIEIQKQTLADIIVYHDNDEIMNEFFHYGRISRNLAARLFKFDLFKDIKFEETRQIVDVVTLPLLLQRCKKYIFTTEKYYYAYEAFDSVSRGDYTNRHHDDFIYSLSFFEKFTEKYYPYHTNYVLYRKTYVIKDCYCDIVKSKTFIDKKRNLSLCIKMFRDNYSDFKKTDYYKKFSLFTKIRLAFFYFFPSFYATLRNKRAVSETH